MDNGTRIITLNAELNVFMIAEYNLEIIDEQIITTKEHNGSI
jgi:hypothetical protein